MKNSKKKKIKDDDLEDDGRIVPFEALAELTSSEVIEQVKNGMSRIAPLENEESDSEETSY